MHKETFGPFLGNDALSEYISNYRRSELPPLQVSEPFDLYPLRPPAKNIIAKLNWNKNKWPFDTYPGVYLLYDENLDLIYVGKTSMKRCLGKRLYDYFGGDPAACKPKKDMFVPVRFVINIAVPMELAFEAPAIEEFLIRKLQPRRNSTGK